jgi:hypothetical protein
LICVAVKKCIAFFLIVRMSTSFSQKKTIIEENKLIMIHD